MLYRRLSGARERVLVPNSWDVDIEHWVMTINKLAIDPRKYDSRIEAVKWLYQWIIAKDAQNTPIGLRLFRTDLRVLIDRNQDQPARLALLELVIKMIQKKIPVSWCGKELPGPDESDWKHVLHDALNLYIYFNIGTMGKFERATHCLSALCPVDGDAIVLTTGAAVAGLVFGGQACSLIGLTSAVIRIAVHKNWLARVFNGFTATGEVLEFTGLLFSEPHPFLGDEHIVHSLGGAGLIGVSIGTGGESYELHIARENLKELNKRDPEYALFREMIRDEYFWKIIVNCLISVGSATSGFGLIFEGPKWLLKVGAAFIGTGISLGVGNMLNLYSNTHFEALEYNAMGRHAFKILAEALVLVHSRRLAQLSDEHKLALKELLWPVVVGNGEPSYPAFEEQHSPGKGGFKHTVEWVAEQLLARRTSVTINGQERPSTYFQIPALFDYTSHTALTDPEMRLLASQIGILEKNGDIVRPEIQRTLSQPQEDDPDHVAIQIDPTILEYPESCMHLYRSILDYLLKYHLAHKDLDALSPVERLRLASGILKAGLTEVPQLVHDQLHNSIPDEDGVQDASDTLATNGAHPVAEERNGREDSYIEAISSIV
ncbi:MAG: hypothetical protein O3A01_06810 [bacterium]|nr:hypothetical protein [bacterium]